MDLIESAWNYFTKNFIEVIGVFIAYFSFFIPIRQYIDQRKLEEKDKRFTNYHKLIKELVDPEGEPRIDRQIAVVFELRNYPEYFEVTNRILESLSRSWSSVNVNIINEISLTIDFINYKLSNTAKQVKASDEKYDPTNPLVFILTFVIFLIGCFLYVITITLLNQSDFNVKDFIANHNGYLWLAGAGSVSAIYLYRFKSRQQFWYGIVEIAFGLLSMGIILVKMSKTILATGIDSSSTIGSVSAVYLVIRGLSNVSDGYSKSFVGKIIITKFSRQKTFFDS